MASGFRLRNTSYAAKFSGEEREVVAGLMEQTRSILDPQDAPGPSADAAPSDAPSDAPVDSFDAIVAGIDLPPDVDPAADPDRDPALGRLLPPASRDDAEAAAEFRRFTERDLRERKTEALTASIAVLREDNPGAWLELDKEQAQTMLVALTDTRLLLGERLGITTDEDAATLEERTAGLDPDDPVAYAVAFYDFLTWMQESLTTAVMGGGRRPLFRRPF